MSLLNNFETDEGAHEAERHNDIPTVSPVDNYKLMLKRGGIIAPLMNGGTTPSLRDTITSKSLPFNNPHPVDFDVDLQSHSGLAINGMHNSQGATSNRYEHSYEYGESGNEREERVGRNREAYSPGKVASNMESTQTDEPEYTPVNQQQIHQQNSKNNRAAEANQIQNRPGVLNQNNVDYNNAKPTQSRGAMINIEATNHKNSDRINSDQHVFDKEDGESYDKGIQKLRPTERNQQRIIGHYENLGEHQVQNHEAKLSKQESLNEEKQQPSGNKMNSESNEHSKEQKPDLSREDLNSQGKNYKSDKSQDVQGLMTEKGHYVTANNKEEHYQATPSNDDGENKQNHKESYDQNNSHVTSMSGYKANKGGDPNNMPTTRPQQGVQQQQQFKNEHEEENGNNKESQRQQSQSKNQDFEGKTNTAENTVPGGKLTENSFQGEVQDNSQKNNYSAGEGTYNGDGKIKDPKLKAELYNQYVYKQELQNNKQPSEANNEKSNQEFSKEEDNSKNANRYEGTLYKDQNEETTDQYGNVIAKQKYKGTLFLYDKGENGEKMGKEQQSVKTEPMKSQINSEQFSENENTSSIARQQNEWNDVEGQSRHEGTDGRKEKVEHENERKNTAKARAEGNHDRTGGNFENKEYENESRNKEKFGGSEKSLSEEGRQDERPKGDGKNINQNEKFKTNERNDREKDWQKEMKMANENGNENSKSFEHGHEHAHGHDDHDEHGEHGLHVGYEERGQEQEHMLKKKIKEESDQKQASKEDDSKTFESNKIAANPNERNKEDDKGSGNEKQGFHYDTGESRNDGKQKSTSSGQSGNDNLSKQNTESEHENLQANEKEGEKKINESKEQKLKNNEESNKNDGTQYEQSQGQNNGRYDKEPVVNENQHNEGGNETPSNNKNNEENTEKEKQLFKEGGKAENEKTEELKENKENYEGKISKNTENESGKLEQQRAKNSQGYKGEPENESEKKKQEENQTNEMRKEDQKELEKLEEKIGQNEKDSLENQKSGQASIADLEENGNGYETINDIVKYPRKNFRSLKNGGENNNIENRPNNQNFNNEQHLGQSTENLHGKEFELKQDGPANKVVTPEKYNGDSERRNVNEFHSEMDRNGEGLKSMENLRKNKKIEGDENDELKSRRFKQKDGSNDEKKLPGKSNANDIKPLKLGPKGPSVWHKPPRISQIPLHHEGISRNGDSVFNGAEAKGGKGPSLLNLNIAPNQPKGGQSKASESNINNVINKQVSVIKHPGDANSTQQQQPMDPEQQMLMKESEKAGKKLNCTINYHSQQMQLIMLQPTILYFRVS